MRAVLDANVLVSAAIGSGPPHRIVNLWRTRRSFDLIACPRLLAEVASVLLDRPRTSRLISRSAATALLDMLVVEAVVVPDPIAPERFTRDPNDDYLVSLARGQHADIIVSGDRDLLDWDGQEPPVMAPADFEALLADTP